MLSGRLRIILFYNLILCLSFIPGRIIQQRQNSQPRNEKECFSSSERVLPSEQTSFEAYGVYKNDAQEGSAHFEEEASNIIG